MTSEPTLRDIFDVLTSLDTKVEAHRRETAALRQDAEAHRRETEAHREETARSFAELDRELSRLADPLHRNLERRIAAPEAVAKRPPLAPRRARRRG